MALQANFLIAIIWLMTFKTTTNANTFLGKDFWTEQMTNPDRKWGFCKYTYDNKYGTNVTSWVLSDPKGLMNNKLLAELEIPIAIHGVWPAEICDYAGNRISMKEITSVVHQQILNDIKSNIVVLRRQYDQIVDFSQNGGFFYHEYVKHYYKNGYRVSKYASDLKNALERFNENGITNAYPHSIRFSVFNNIEQIVSVKEPSKVKVWNYKLERKFGFHFRIPSTNDTIVESLNKEMKFCLTPSLEIVCLHELKKNLTDPTTPIVETILNVVKSKDLHTGVVLTRMVREGEELYQDYKAGQWQNILVKMIGLSAAIGSTTTQFIGKIKPYERKISTMENIYIKSSIFVLSSTTIASIGYYYDLSYHSILENIIYWSVFAFLINCVINIINKFNKFKTIASVILSIIAFSLIFYLQSEELISNKNYQTYGNFVTIDETFKFLTKNNLSDLVETSKVWIDYELNLKALTIMVRLVIIPAIIIYTLFRKTISKIIYKMKDFDREYVTVTQISVINIFGIIMFFGILYVNYDFFGIYKKAELKSFIANLTGNSGLLYLKQDLPADLHEQLMFYFGDLDTTMVGIVSILSLIVVLSQIGLEIGVKNFGVIRFSEITLFVCFTIYKFETILEILTRLASLSIETPMLSWQVFVNFLALLVVGLVLQLYANYTTSFFIMSQYLIILPLLTTLYNLKFFGIKYSFKIILNELNWNDHESTLFIFATIACIIYINHCIFGVSAIYRHINNEKKFIEEKAWKRGLFRCFFSIFKVFVSIIGAAYFLQHVIPIAIRSRKAHQGFFLVWGPLALVNLWFGFFIYQMYNCTKLYSKARFGNYNSIKYCLVGVFFMNILFASWSWLATIFFSIRHYYHFTLLGAYVVDFVPTFLAMLIFSWLSFVVTPVIEKLRYWISVHSENKYGQLFMGTIIEIIRNQFMTIIFLCKWSTFLGGTIKAAKHMIDLTATNDGPFWIIINIFMSLFTTFGFGILFFDLMFNIIYVFVNWMNQGVAFKWLTPYVRTSAENVIENAKNSDYLNTKVEINGVEKTIMEHLLAGEIAFCENETTTVIGAPFTSKTNQTRLTKEVHEQGEDQMVNIGGVSQHLNCIPTRLDQSESNVKNSEKLSSSVRGGNTQTLSSAKKLTELGLAKSCKFVKQDRILAIKSWMPMECGSKIIDSSEYMKNTSALESKTLYCPFKNEIRAELNELTASAHISSFGNANPHSSKPIIDLLDKGQKLTYFDGEFVEYDTVYVAEDFSKDLELVNIIDTTPISIITKFFDFFGMKNVSSYFTTTQLNENANVNYLYACNTDLEKELFSDHVYTLHEWMLETKKCIQDIFYMCDFENNADKKLHVFVNESGKLFCTENKTTATNLSMLKNNKGEKIFDVLNYKTLAQVTPVRPFMINTYMTVSTSTTTSSLHVLLEKDTEALFSPLFGIYLTREIDMSKYPGSEISHYLKNNQELRVTIGCSTGMVYCKSPSKTGETNIYNKEKQLGSCSLVRNVKKSNLYIVTNLHVVQDVYDERCQAFKDNRTRKVTDVCYRKDLIAVFGFGGKTIEIPFKKLLFFGRDVAVFSMAKSDANDYISHISNSTLRSTSDIWENMALAKEFKMKNIGKDDEGYLSQEGACFLNAVRQTERVYDNEKSQVRTRMVVLQYNTRSRLYEILGYSTPGYSGSPIYTFEREYDESTKSYKNFVFQVGIVSAVERIGNTKVHMTRYIEMSKTAKAIEKIPYDVDGSIIKCDGEFINFDSVLPCKTEHLEKIWREQEILQWCGIIDTNDYIDKFSKSRNVEESLDTIFTSLDNEKEIKKEYFKYKNYYNIYDQDFDMLHLPNGSFEPEVWVGDEKQIAKNKEKYSFEHINWNIPESVPERTVMDLSNIANGITNGHLIRLDRFGITECLNIIEQAKDNMWCVFAKGRVSYVWVPECIDDEVFWHVYIGEIRDHKFYNYKLLGMADYVTIDTQFLLEIARSNCFVTVEDWVRNFAKIGTSNNIYTAVNAGGYWYYDVYEKTNENDTTLKIKKGHIDLCDIESGTCLIFDDTDPTIAEFCGAFEITEGQMIMDRIKQITDELREIKSNQKLINSKIMKIRSRIQDYQQSPDFIERRRRYEEELEEYNNKKKISSNEMQQNEILLKEHQELKRQIEQDYVNKIKALRNEKIQNNMYIKDYREKINLKNKKQTSQLDLMIEKKQEKKKQLQMEIKKLHDKKKELGAQNDEVIKAREEANKRLSEEIQKLQEEKLEKMESLKQDRQKLIASQPEKPPKELNPEMDPNMKKLREENQQLRQLMNDLKAKESKLREELESMKVAPSASSVSLEDIEKRMSFQWNAFAGFTQKNNEALDQILNALKDIVEDNKRKPKQRINQEDGYERKERESEDNYSSDEQGKKYQDKRGHKRVQATKRKPASKRYKEGDFEQKEKAMENEYSSDEMQRDPQNKKGYVPKNKLPREEPKPQRIKAVIPKPTTSSTEPSTEIARKDYISSSKNSIIISGKQDKENVVRQKNFRKQIVWKDIKLSSDNMHYFELEILNLKSLRIKSMIYRKFKNIIQFYVLKKGFSTDPAISTIFINDVENEIRYYLAVEDIETLKLAKELVEFLHKNETVGDNAWTIHKDILQRFEDICDRKTIKINHIGDVFNQNKIASLLINTGRKNENDEERKTLIKLVITKDETPKIKEKLNYYSETISTTKKLLISEKSSHEPFVKTLITKWTKLEDNNLPEWMNDHINKGTFFENFNIVVEYEAIFETVIKELNSNSQVFRSGQKKEASQ